MGSVTKSCDGVLFPVDRRQAKRPEKKRKATKAASRLERYSGSVRTTLPNTLHGKSSFLVPTKVG